MIITKQVVSAYLLQYLNREITLAELVDWAERSFIDAALEPEADLALLNDILSYLAAADSAQFPLTWELCRQFMAQLGTPIRVIAATA